MNVTVKDWGPKTVAKRKSPGSTVLKGHSALFYVYLKIIPANLMRLTLKYIQCQRTSFKEYLLRNSSKLNKTDSKINTV